MTEPSASERTRRSYARIAGLYDRRWERYLDDSISAALKALTLGPEERILDVGCGTGRLLREALRGEPTIAAWGLDLSPEMVREAVRREGRQPHLLVADAAAIPFRGAAFDVLVSTSSLHHWPEPGRVLAEFARVLRPGGRLVITDWRRDVLTFLPVALYYEWTDRAVHRVHSRGELESLVGAAGFEVREVTTSRAARYWALMTLTARRVG